MTKVRKGTLCFMSEIGYYNFKYPDRENIGKFIEEAEVRLLAYLGGGSFVAVEAKSKNLDSDYSSNNISSVVWVRPKDLI
jgi:hypothetical protein